MLYLNLKAYENSYKWIPQLLSNTSVLLFLICYMKMLQKKLSIWRQYLKIRDMNFEHNTINHEIELVSGVYRFKSLIWGAGRHYQKKWNRGGGGKKKNKNARHTYQSQTNLILEINKTRALTHTHRTWFWSMIEFKSKHRSTAGF